MRVDHGKGGKNRTVKLSAQLPRSDRNFVFGPSVIGGDKPVHKSAQLLQPSQRGKTGSLSTLPELAKGRHVGFSRLNISVASS
jgi:hypothetical protein